MIWFKADIDPILDNMVDFVWPCPAPKHLALIELLAIIHANKLHLWSHERLATRFNRPVSWARTLRTTAFSQIKSRYQAGDTQAVDSQLTDDPQARSDNTAVFEASTSSSQAAVKQQSSSSQAGNNTPHARASDSRSEIRDADIDQIQTKTEKEPPISPLAGEQQQLPAIPPKASAKRQVKPPADPKPPTPEKPPMPAKYDGHPHSRQIAGLWYGTECAAKGGPDAEGFILAVDAIVAFVDAQGQGFAVDRPVFHYVRAAIRQWIDSGQPYQAVIDAAQADPTEYELRSGFCTVKGRLGSVDAIQRQVAKSRAPSFKPSTPAPSKTNALGGMQTGRTQEEWKQILEAGRDPNKPRKFSWEYTKEERDELSRG